MWIDENGFPRTKRYEIRMSESVVGELCLRIFKDGSPLKDGHLVIFRADDVIPCRYVNKRASKKLGIRLAKDDRFSGFDHEKISKAKRKKPKSGPGVVSKELQNGYRLETWANIAGNPAFVLAGNGARFALASIAGCPFGSMHVMYRLTNENAIHARRAGLKINDKNKWETT